MQLFIQTLLVITYVTGTFCQKITFDKTDAGGITAGRFYVDGTIGGNVTELVHQNWQPIIIIQVMKIKYSRFSFMCQFDVSYGATCVPYPVGRCQCVYNTTTDNVHFVVNDTAGPDLYNAIIRARWQHQNLTTVYSNKNYTVPGPNDPEMSGPESADSSHQNTGAIVGGIVAAVLVIVVIAAAICFLKRKGVPCKPRDHQYAITSVDALKEGDASGAPYKQKEVQYFNTIMNTAYENDESGESPKTQTPEKAHYEETRTLENPYYEETQAPESRHYEEAQALEIPHYEELQAHESRHYEELQAPESRHYEEIDLQTDVPDKPVDSTNQIPKIRHAEVEYQNAV